MQIEENINKLRDRVNELSKNLDDSKNMTPEEENGLKIIKVYVSAISDALLWVLADKDEDAEYFLERYVMEADIKAILER
jgi:signal transduction histidine kinase